MPIAIFIVAILSFLLGSIPFGYLLVRIFRKQDIRHYGSGNIGATNVARTGSKKLAVATLLLDALKGYIAVAFAHWYAARITDSSGPYSTGEKLSPDTIIMLVAIAGLCAILGHMFTPWLGFEGGKGVATAVGAFAGYRAARRAGLPCALHCRCGHHSLCVAGQHAGSDSLSHRVLVAGAHHA